MSLSGVDPTLAGNRACPVPPKLTFGNRSLSVHLLRGLVGVTALGAGLWGFVAFGWPALLLLPAAVWLLKGCPMCWTQGLFETLDYRRAMKRQRTGTGRTGPHRAATPN